MLTSKDRAKLRSLASTQKSVFQIGKEEISENMVKGLSDALEAHELIKINVLKNCDYSAKDLSGVLEIKLNAETVSVIGNKIILYRVSKKKDFKHIL